MHDPHTCKALGYGKHAPLPTSCMSAGPSPWVRGPPGIHTFPLHPSCTYACPHRCLHPFLTYLHTHTCMHMWTHRAQLCTSSEKQVCTVVSLRTSPAHTLPQSGVSRPGLALKWLSSKQRNADSWGCSASGREGEAQGKPHRQESGQVCQAEVGP